MTVSDNPSKSEPVSGIVQILSFDNFIDTLRNELPDQAHFAIKVEKGDLTVSFDLPDCTSEEYASKFQRMGHLAYLLLEQAYKNGEYRAVEHEEDDLHRKWDVTIA